MPTYEFNCSNCCTKIEGFYSISKRPDALICDKCGEVATNVILGGQGFHLKGSGWGFDRYAGPNNFSNYRKGDNND